jgi:hypothetical protein
MQEQSRRDVVHYQVIHTDTSPERREIVKQHALVQMLIQINLVYHIDSCMIVIFCHQKTLIKIKNKKTKTKIKMGHVLG